MTIRDAAVHNNAVWCDAVCRSLAGDTTWTDGLWLNRSPSPPYYSNAVTITPHAQDAQLGRLRLLLDSALPRPWSVKDAFQALDLAPLGFHVLFEAEWLHLPVAASIGGMPTDHAVALGWSVVTSAAELAAWEIAWRGANPEAAASGLPELFQPTLLSDPDIRFLAGRRGARVVAVAIANRSDDGSGPVVGISNIVVGGDAPEESRAGAVRAVRAAYPGLPLVGYERGDELATMRALGFQPSGRLRVWITSD